MFPTDAPAIPVAIPTAPAQVHLYADDEAEYESLLRGLGAMWTGLMPDGNPLFGWSFLPVNFRK